MSTDPPSSNASRGDMSPEDKSPEDTPPENTPPEDTPPGNASPDESEEGAPGRLARELRRLRELKECSLRDVEEATGISNAYVSQLERGEATGPSPHKLYRLADFYDTSYEALMRAAGYIPEESEEKEPGPFEMQLMSMDLDEDEKDMIVDFVKNFIRKDEDIRKD